MKYAIIPINVKQVSNNLYIRCVLIEFKQKDGYTYKGTRYLDCSPYFRDTSKSLYYKFEDDGYTLIQGKFGAHDTLKMIKREYRTSSISNEDERFSGTAFEATNDEEALEFFRLSVYYDTDSEPLEKDFN